MKITQLIEKLKKPDKKLFFESQDKHDIKLGALVSADPNEYDHCRYIIVSCSQDQGVKRNMGRVGAAEAPDAIRYCLYRLAAPMGLESGQVLDLGDTYFNGSLEEAHAQHNNIVEQLLKDGKIVVVLGGGNDISYPDAKAVQKIYPDSLTVNVDAHLDIRINPVRNSGTPYRQLLDEKIIKPAKFFEIGYQFHANSKEYLSYAEELGVKMIPLRYLLTKPIKKSLEKAFELDKTETCFLGFDMDAVKSADAPGVSAPSPTGISAEQAVQIVEYLTIHKKTQLFEITEVNPKYDMDNRTSKLAAILIHCFLEESLIKLSC